MNEDDNEIWYLHSDFSTRSDVPPYLNSVLVSKRASLSKHYDLPCSERCTAGNHSHLPCPFKQESQGRKHQCILLQKIFSGIWFCSSLPLLQHVIIVSIFEAQKIIFPITIIVSIVFGVCFSASCFLRWRKKSVLCYLR